MNTFELNNFQIIRAQSAFNLHDSPELGIRKKKQETPNFWNDISSLNPNKVYLY